MQVLTLGGKFADAQSIEGLNSGYISTFVLDHKANAAGLGPLQELLAEPVKKDLSKGFMFLPMGYEWAQEHQPFHLYIKLL